MSSVLTKIEEQECACGSVISAIWKSKNTRSLNTLPTLSETHRSNEVRLLCPVRKGAQGL